MKQKRAFQLLPAIAILLLAISSCDPNLEACFTYSFTGNTSSFNAQCSSKADKYEWDFGDGSTSTEQNPNHTFTVSGTFEVELTVRSKSGFKDKFSETIEVDVCEMTCQGGQCQSGNCVCNPGYEGPLCIGMHEKFLGSYNSIETCNVNSSGTFGADIEKGITGASFKIYGIYGNTSIYVVTEIQNDGLNFTAVRQPFFSTLDIEIYTGALNLNTGIIQLSYRLFQSGSNNVYDQCNLTLQK